LRGVPAGWVAENKNGQSPFLVGAREGAALPLYEFDFYYFTFKKNLQKNQKIIMFIPMKIKKIKK
jgi:hypothetical protein